MRYFAILVCTLWGHGVWGSDFYIKVDLAQGKSGAKIQDQRNFTQYSMLETNSYTGFNVVLKDQSKKLTYKINYGTNNYIVLVLQKSKAQEGESGTYGGIVYGIDEQNKKIDDTENAIKAIKRFLSVFSVADSQKKQNIMNYLEKEINRIMGYTEPGPEELFVQIQQNNPVKIQQRDDRSKMPTYKPQQYVGFKYILNTETGIIYNIEYGRQENIKLQISPAQKPTSKTQYDSHSKVNSSQIKCTFLPKLSTITNKETAKNAIQRFIGTFDLGENESKSIIQEIGKEIDRLTPRTI